MMTEVVEWILRRATTRGWAGFLRHSASDEVRHLVRHENGFDVVDTRTPRRDIRVPWS
ncbi:hypothetical protein GCM10009663_74900 [Kitasatospora arboriphila]|uniref:Uncharacterized protein n=2 Tax=Streptomycetaceae TaxID=2062 RepID=A0ABN1U6U5_9ACTN